MKKNTAVLLLILAFPLFIGIGIGYVLKPSEASSREADTAFDKAFPTAVRVQDKSADAQDQVGGSRRTRSRARSPKSVRPLSAST